MREVNVVVLPGDGIGPEVVAEAIRAVEIVAADADLSITWREELMGGCSIDAHGTALTDAVLGACQSADAVLLGAVGGPKWDTTDPAKPRPEQGLLGPACGAGPVRQPAAGQAARGTAGTRAPCAGSGSPEPTCWSCGS